MVAAELAEQEIIRLLTDQVLEASGCDEEDLFVEQKPRMNQLLEKDLGFESIDNLDLIFRLEKTFGIKISKGHLPFDRELSFGNLIEYVQRALTDKTDGEFPNYYTTEFPQPNFRLRQRTFRDAGFRGVGYELIDIRYYAEHGGELFPIDPDARKTELRVPSIQPPGYAETRAIIYDPNRRNYTIDSSDFVQRVVTESQNSVTGLIEPWTEGLDPAQGLEKCKILLEEFAAKLGRQYTEY